VLERERGVDGRINMGKKCSQTMKELALKLI